MTDYRCFLEAEVDNFIPYDNVVSDESLRKKVVALVADRVFEIVDGYRHRDFPELAVLRAVSMVMQKFGADEGERLEKRRLKPVPHDDEARP